MLRWDKSCDHFAFQTRLRSLRAEGDERWDCDCAPSKRGETKLHAPGKCHRNSSYISSEVRWSWGWKLLWLMSSDCFWVWFTYCLLGSFYQKAAGEASISLKQNCLELSGENKASTVLPWLKSQPGGRSQTCFLLLPKQVLFFSPSSSYEVDKESSRQPYERDEPDHPRELQYFCVHLQMWMAQVAAVLPEPAKAWYSRNWFLSRYPVLVSEFFPSLKHIFIQYTQLPWF